MNSEDETEDHDEYDPPSPDAHLELPAPGGPIEDSEGFQFFVMIHLDVVMHDSPQPARTLGLHLIAGEPDGSDVFGALARHAAQGVHHQEPRAQVGHVYIWTQDTLEHLRIFADISQPTADVGVGEEGASRSGAATSTTRPGESDHRERRVTNDDFARQLGIHFTMASKLRNGSRKPSIDTLLRIREAYDIDGNALLDAYASETLHLLLEQRIGPTRR
jgi:transcriptional regulator with XRE-family HTH domain